MFERTLIITPHCDDETIGCGGLIHKLVSNNKPVDIALICRHRDHEIRLAEMREAMSILCGGKVGSYNLSHLSYEDGLLDTVAIKNIVTYLDQRIFLTKPTAVFFPYASHHQDHQVLNRACISALRPTVGTNFIKLKAMYEYPYLGSWGIDTLPSGRMYLPLTEEELEVKKNALLAYESQLIRDSRDILDASSIMDFARVRGREIGQYAAESYYPLTTVIGEGL